MATGLASGHRAPILLIASLSAALIVIHVALFGDAARRVMFPARVFDERRDALILPRNRTEARFDRVWMESTGPNSGLVHVRFDKSCLSDVGHPVLRIRVMGPQILLLDAKPTSDPAYWIAPYTIECIGRYTIEVMPLFTDFVEEDIKHGQIIAQWPPFFDLHEFFISVETAHCPLRTSWAESPVCTPELMDKGGTWIIDPSDDFNDEETFPVDTVRWWLERTNFAMGPGEEPPHDMLGFHRFYYRDLGIPNAKWEHPQIKVRFARLQYRFFHCQLQDDGLNWVKRCGLTTPEQRICVFGDSQMRLLHTMLSEVVDPTNEVCAGTYTQDVCPSDYVRYTPDLYGSVSPGACSGCTHVLFNFGQHPLGWTENPPFPGERFRQMVRDLFQRFKGSNLKAYWVSVNTMAFNRRVMQNFDWRHPGTIPYYNRIAAEEAKKVNFPVIDIYSISSVLNDISYDGGHYKAPVARPYALKALTTACHAE
ncbi:unnamed protein product (mitochondrion) [Plasmodiophora brassicae]|uniref:Uncharacterized protein n=1 Tax=Plasmodiophora brassicae TaxID=37360 RepID=A0A0G4IHT5_PLABS|nr:hypothetical protein PBRA_003557 [Plasmodiophora brassicae]SPQ98704.1 unnamed protein product [Plasmodiophora brassicae]